MKTIIIFLSLVFSLSQAGENACETVAGNSLPGFNFKVSPPQKYSNCQAVFVADTQWESNYPSCTAKVINNGCPSPPNLYFEGGSCYPEDTGIQIGQILIVLEEEVLHVYNVSTELAGGGVIILIEEI